VKGPLPTSVLLPRSDDVPYYTPDEFRALEQASGRTFLDLMDTTRTYGVADALQAMIYLTLHRAGYDPTWQDCAEVQAVVEAR
jgi:hypothetical protein